MILFVVDTTDNIKLHFNVICAIIFVKNQKKVVNSLKETIDTF